MEATAGTRIGRFVRSRLGALLLFPVALGMGLSGFLITIVALSEGVIGLRRGSGWVSFEDAPVIFLLSLVWHAGHGLLGAIVAMRWPFRWSIRTPLVLGGACLGWMAWELVSGEAAFGTRSFRRAMSAESNPEVFVIWIWSRSIFVVAWWWRAVAALRTQLRTASSGPSRVVATIVRTVATLRDALRWLIVDRRARRWTMGILGLALLVVTWVLTAPDVSSVNDQPLELDPKAAQYREIEASQRLALERRREQRAADEARRAREHEAAAATREAERAAAEAARRSNADDADFINQLGLDLRNGTPRPDAAVELEAIIAADQNTGITLAAFRRLWELARSEMRYVDARQVSLREADYRAAQSQDQVAAPTGD